MYLKVTIVNLLVCICCTSCSSDDSFQCPEPDGSFQSRSNCSEYYSCSGGIATKQSCGSHQGFHASWKQCTWEGMVVQCVQEKGGRLCGSLPTTSSGDPRAQAPWTVAVVQRNESMPSGWAYVGPGMIISPSLVITTCRLGRTTKGNFQLNLNASLYQVMAGSSTAELSNVAQRLQVRLIQLNPKSGTESDSRCNALLHLKEPLNLEDPNVKAICLPAFGRNHNSNSNGLFSQGKISVTAFLRRRQETTEVMVTRTIPLGSQPYCKIFGRNFTCREGIRPPKGSNVFQVCAARESIAAIYYPPVQRWYALGYGSGLVRGMCRIKQIDDEIKLEWIVNALRCGDSQFPCRDGSCIDLDFMCNGNAECSNGEDEDPLICQPTPTEQSTTPTIEPSPSFNAAAALPFAERMETLVRTCGLPDVPEGVSFSCGPPGNPNFSACSNSLLIGTQMKLYCSAGYRAAGLEATVVRTCNPELKWRPPRSLACTPDCGRLAEPMNANHLIVNGIEANERRFPWHVALFILPTTTTGDREPEYICGGTLIHRKFVVTAGHCLVRSDASDYRIVLAPQSSRYFVNKQSRFTQLREVTRVQRHERFDPSQNYQGDIALMELAEAAVLNDCVNPACLPSESMRNDPLPGEQGYIPGFGVDQTGHVSETLKALEIPVVGVLECRKAIGMTPSFTQYCAGLTNGTGVCNGDSGGGMVFQGDDERYYIRGIVSLGPRMKGDQNSFSCDFNTYSMYTSVIQYKEWIQNTISKFEALSR